MHRQMGRYVLASLILASCSGRGDVRVQENDTLLYLAAPPPFSSGVSARGLDEELNLRFLPPLREAEQMEYTERIAAGFRLALEQGIDMFYGVTSVLLGIGRRFSQGHTDGSLAEEGLNPAVAARMAAAKMKVRMARQPLLPRDLWRVKGIMSGGTDTEIFREEVARLWGVSPLEAYGGTEMGLLALQSWDRRGLVFVPDVDFLEFIPEEEALRTRSGDHTPPTVLLPDLEPDKNYELVITNFHGGAYVRYRTRDLFHVHAMANPSIGVKLPHFAFHSRLDDVIDLAGFTRLTERTIWKAIRASEVPCSDWLVRKEMEAGEPVLRLYLEPPPASADVDPAALRDRVDQALKDLDTDYRNLEEMIGLHPLQVTVLSPGTFQRYTATRVAEGADLGHYKPARINPSEQTLQQLLQLGKSDSTDGAG
jgi:hypothetical protein